MAHPEIIIFLYMIGCKLRRCDDILVIIRQTVIILITSMNKSEA